MENEIEIYKAELMKIFNELDEEVRILWKNLQKAKTALKDVKTEEDVEKYMDEYILEKGLKHIELN